MGKVKVCHVVSGLRSGGVESMIYNYCSRMDGDKFEFSILYQHTPSEKNVNEFEQLNFKLIKIPNKTKRPISNFFATYNYLRKNHIDVVHCHMTLMNIIPLIAAKFAGVRKRICHSHGSDIRKKIFIIRFVEKIIKKICIRLSTDLYACGEDAGKYLYNNKKFVTINNALILSKYQYNIEARIKIRKQYQINKNEKIILHVGRFEEQKNHYFLIDFMEKVLKENNNYKLILIGDGPLRKTIEELVTKKNIPNVIFAGILPNVNDYYSASDLFILPSKYEGLPVSALEAQVSGIKCLLSSNIDHHVVVISKNVKLIDNDIIKWQTELTDEKNYERNQDLKKFDDYHLNIDIEYKKLEEEYLSVLGDRE